MLVSCLLSLCVPALYGQPRPNRKATTLILERVTVIDSTGSPAKPDVLVLIVDGKIQSISRTAKTKPVSDAIVIDATGKFLIAGLWDMHVHALSKNEPDRFFPLFIANGVTGIRDMGGDIPLAQIAQIKKEIASGSRLGPEIFAAGPILEGELPFWPFSIAVKSPTDARRAVTRLTEEGADFLKVYNTLSRDSYLAIAAQAKELKIPFVGHIPDGVTPSELQTADKRALSTFGAFQII